MEKVLNSKSTAQMIEETPDEAQEELMRLLTLEQRNIAATGLLQEVLDAKYVAMRKELTKIMLHVSVFYDSGKAAVPQAMALLDAYRVRSVHSEGISIELAAVALLGVAVSLVRDPTCSQKPGENSLSLLCDRWLSQLKLLDPETLGYQSMRLGALDRQERVKALKAAQVHVLVTLEWRLSVATADVLLESMLAVDIDNSMTNEDCAKVRHNARTLCELGLLRGYTWFYGQSVLAAACVHAARLVFGIEPLCTQELAARYSIVRIHDMECCVKDLVHAHNECELKIEQEVSRTPSPQKKKKQ